MRSLRVLVVIASFGRKNDIYLRRLVAEYSSMPYQCKIFVCSNVEKDIPEGVDLVVGLPTSDPWSLPFAHKKIMADRVDEYDLFIYSEDDTLATHENIEAFLRVSPKLRDNEIAGFLRYELCPDGTIRYCDVNGHYHWDHSSVVQRGSDKFAFFTNEHAAFYILTRSQLKRAIASGGFLVPPHHGKYDLACSAATDPYTQCGFSKLVCISSLGAFLLHHLPNKYIGTQFGTSEIIFEMQLHALTELSEDLKSIGVLVPVQTRLQDAWYSKDYYEPARREVLDSVPPAARTVVSVGCGSGESERELVRRGMEVCAVCLDPVIAACARSSSIETVCGDWKQVSSQLGGRTFDALLINNVLHLAPEPEAMLRMFLQHLGPGGAIVIVSPNLRTPKVLAARLRGQESFRHIGDYEKSGTNILAGVQLKKWLYSYGADRIGLVHFIPAGRHLFSRFTAGLFDSMLASDFVITGYKQLVISGRVATDQTSLADHTR